VLQNQDQSNFFSYVSLLSIIVSSITFQYYSRKYVKFLRLLLAVLVALSYSYLSTGRTFVLFFFILHFIPLLIHNSLKMRGLLVSFISITTLITLISTMTSKGISVDISFMDNLL
jgi:hypothetical protein